MTAMVKAEGVHKRFGRLEVLKGIDLEVQPGQVMCILGPSGSGKTTFIRCINHLEQINAGRLWVDGELVGYRQVGDTLHELPDRIRLKTITYSPTRVLDGVKSLSYAANMLTRRLAQEAGFDDALLVTPHGRVLEAPTASIFCYEGVHATSQPTVANGSVPALKVLAFSLLKVLKTGADHS